VVRDWGEAQVKQVQETDYAGSEGGGVSEGFRGEARREWLPLEPGEFGLQPCSAEPIVTMKLWQETLPEKESSATHRRS